MSDDHTFVHSFRSGFDNILCNTSGRSAYGIDVHAVGSGADNAAKPRSTKVHILEEMFTHLAFVFLQFQKLCMKRIRLRYICKPQIETIFKIHQSYTSLSHIAPAVFPDCHTSETVWRLSANL